MKRDFATVQNNASSTKSLKGTESELYFASSTNYSIQSSSKELSSDYDSHSYVVEWEMSVTNEDIGSR